jgi:hypothetical protein
VQLEVQFSQRQIGLRSNPCSYLTLRLNPGVRLAPRPVWHALGLTTALALCGNLLCPANTDQKAGRQLFQRTLALVVGQQKLTAQIIPIGSPHLFTRRRQSPKSVYTITGNALAGNSGSETGSHQTRSTASFPANFFNPKINN